MIIARIRVFVGLLLVTSLLGYMEWGKDSKAFLFESEAIILSKLFTDFVSVIHPLILLPLAGQLLLLVVVFQSRPSVPLIYAGLGLLCLIMLVILLAGIFGTNPRMILSVAPFLTVAAFTLAEARKIARMRRTARIAAAQNEA